MLYFRRGCERARCDVPCERQENLSMTIKSLGRISIVLLSVFLCRAAFPQGDVSLVQTPTGDGVTGLANDFYIPGRVIRLRMEIAAVAGNPKLTFLDLNLPNNWNLLGVSGASAPNVVPLGGSGALRLGWLGAPVLPIAFFVDVEVPADETRQRTINTRVRYVDDAGSPQLGTFVPSTLRRDTLAPVLTLIGGGITLNCRDVFVDPGVTADDNAEGDITGLIQTAGFVNTSVPGRYEITYSIEDRSGNRAQVRRLVAVLANCPEDQPATCANNCATDNGADADGDGLTDCEERCFYGTETDDPDTDDDGMDDEYEVRFMPTLNPLDPSDRNEDPDGDGFTNLEEYLRQGSPIDTGSPQRAFFVGPNGFNTPLSGTRVQPYRTIQYAMNIAAGLASAQQRSTIILLPGLYDLDVTVLPYVTLAGDPGAVLRGRVILQREARLERLTVEGDSPDAVLVTLRDESARARVRNVVLRNAAVGVRTLGTGPAEAELDGCTFENLELGLEIEGGIPTLRRSIFRNIASTIPGGESAAIILRERATKQADVQDEGNLGAMEDASAGYNTFVLPSIEGAAVINERAELVKIEQNDWNTDNEEEIGSAVVGNVDFIPYLKAGSALFASSLFATVTDAGSRERITNASVRLAPGTVEPQTRNEDGVYPFAAIGEGNYNLTASAPGFEDATLNVNVGPGQIINVIIPLGEEPEERGCNRGGDKTAASTVPPLEWVVMSAGILAVLIMASRRVRRNIGQ